MPAVDGGKVKALLSVAFVLRAARRSLRPLAKRHRSRRRQRQREREQAQLRAQRNWTPTYTPARQRGRRLLLRRPSLTTVGRRHEVTKANPRSWSGRALTDYYEPFVAPMRNRRIRVLELGVKEGRSLRMWKDYFPNATIVGVDLSYKRYINESRIQVVSGDQRDAETIQRAVELAGGPLDLICDDGSHYADGQVGALTLLWPHLAPDGIYMIDDVHTSYRASYDMGWRQPGTTIEYLKNCLDDIHVAEHGHGVVLSGLAEAHFYFHLVVLRKAARGS